jgi:hypothetical protein
MLLGYLMTILYGHLIYFVVIWNMWLYSTFSRFGMLYQEILAVLVFPQ